MFKIQHIASGQFFVSKLDDVCTIEQHTTLFNNQYELLGSLSMPGDLPLEPNKAIIQNAHHILTSNNLRTLRVRVWLGDVPYKEGVFTYTIENNLIKYIMYFDISTIAALLKTRKLAEATKDEDIQQFTFNSYCAW